MLKKLFIFLSLFLLLFFYSFADDALDDVLGTDSAAWQYQIISSKNGVSSLVKWSKGILWSKDKEPLIIRLAEFWLKLTVMIWVLVFLVGGIRFLLSMWDDSKAKKVRNSLLVAVLWFVIAFFARVILQIIMSIWPTLNW